MRQCVFHWGEKVAELQAQMRERVAKRQAGLARCRLHPKARHRVIRGKYGRVRLECRRCAERKARGRWRRSLRSKPETPVPAPLPWKTTLDPYRL